MKQYETMVILDAMLSDDVIASEVQSFADKITAAGEILRRDDWGKRKLAYEIKHKTHGYYVIFYYKAEASVVSTLENIFKLDGNVLRWMTLADYPMTEVIYDKNMSQTQPHWYDSKFWEVLEIIGYKSSEKTDIFASVETH